MYTMSKIVLAGLVLCVVYVSSDDYLGHNRMPEFVRIKRAKYYSSPPMRFYKRPPIPQPVKGIFSYTPPPGYMDHNEPHPGNFKPKVSKRPTNDGLEDDDINNLVKHLSKQDLDKIIEFAGEKYKESPFDKYSASFNKISADNNNDINVYKTPVRELSSADQKFLMNGPYESNPAQTTYDMDYREQSRPPVNNKSFNKYPIDSFNDMSIYKTSARELTNVDQTFLMNGPYESNSAKTNYDMDYRDQSKPSVNSKAFNPNTGSESLSFRGPLANVYMAAPDQSYQEQNAPPKQYHSSPPFPSRPQNLADVSLHTEESMQNNQFTFVDTYIQQELNSVASEKTSTINTFTDSETLKEEQLPKPLNLREDQDYQLPSTLNVPNTFEPSSYQDHELSSMLNVPNTFEPSTYQDYQAASTNNVPNVVKASSYQVESFGDLPLMETNSKRDSVSSYHVPHYTVVSPSNNRPPPPPSYIPPSSSSQLVPSPGAAAIKAPKVEPAPPASVAKQQSDAHLKATKIWTHKSKGTAYTLHDDGSLSLERPQRPKPVYGY